MMNKPYIRLIRRKTKKAFSLSLEIILGFYPIDNDKIRKDDLKFLFTRTIQPMGVIEKEYDASFLALKDHEKAKLITYTKLLQS